MLRICLGIFVVDFRPNDMFVFRRMFVSGNMFVASKGCAPLFRSLFAEPFRRAFPQSLSQSHCRNVFPRAFRNACRRAFRRALTNEDKSQIESV